MFNRNISDKQFQWNLYMIVLVLGILSNSIVIGFLKLIFFVFDSILLENICYMI